MLKKNCAYLALFEANIAFFVKIFTKYFIHPIFIRKQETNRQSPPVGFIIIKHPALFNCHLP